MPWRAEIAEPEATEDDGETAGSHGGTGPHRGEPDSERWIKQAGGQRDAESVVNECEEQVAADGPHRMTGEMQ